MRATRATTTSHVTGLAVFADGRDRAQSLLLPAKQSFGRVEQHFANASAAMILPVFLIHPMLGMIDAP